MRVRRRVQVQRVGLGRRPSGSRFAESEDAGRARRRAGSTSRGDRTARAPIARTAAAGCRTAAALRSRSGCRAWSARSRCSWSGWRKSVHQPRSVAFTVASCPAFSSSTQVPTSSSSVSRSPSSTTVDQLGDQVVARASARARARARGGSPRTRGSRGPRRRCRLRRGVQLVHPADVRRPRTQQVAVALGDAEHLRDHGDRQRLGERRQQVDLAGVVDSAEQRPSTIRSTRGRRPSTKPGVNAFDTSRRTRVWSAPSMSRIPALISRQNGACQAGGAARPISSCDGHVQVRAAESPITQERVDVGVPGDQPVVGRLVVGDRRRSRRSSS